MELEKAADFWSDHLQSFTQYDERGELIPASEADRIRLEYSEKHLACIEETRSGQWRTGVYITDGTPRAPAAPERLDIPDRSRGRAEA